MLPQNLYHSSSWSDPLLLLFAFVRGGGPTPDVCDEFVQVLYQSKSWFGGHGQIFQDVVLFVNEQTPVISLQANVTFGSFVSQSKHSNKFCSGDNGMQHNTSRRITMIETVFSCETINDDKSPLLFMVNCLDPT